MAFFEITQRKTSKAEPFLALLCSVKSESEYICKGGRTGGANSGSVLSRAPEPIY
jgi:hypothetical protein